MTSIRRLIKVTLLGLVAVFSSIEVIGCTSFPEASFELASESRLPVWFTLSQGLTRADVSVTMDYYVEATGRRATFKLFDKRHHVLGTVAGSLRGLRPVSMNGSSQAASGYPMFEIVNVNGVVEVVEHKAMEPIFYIPNDPGMVKAILLSSP